jgi:amino acid adenylation domain-containing protein/non-ribosomal peptide synthase protein (TIGR01720 family)
MTHDAEQIARRFARLSPDARRDFLDKFRANGLSFAELPIVPAENRDAPPLSYAQRSLWLTWRMDPESPAYNMPGVLHLTGELDPAALRDSLGDLAARHDALRTLFVPGAEGEAGLLIRAAGGVDLPLADLRDVPEQRREDEARARLRAFAAAPFRLDREAPLRAALFRLDDRRHLLALAVHHIAADAWSLRILIDELAVLYAARAEGRPAELPALPIRFADYAVWQRNWLEAGERERQLAYWLDRLGREHPILELPTDRPRAAGGSDEGRHDFALPPALSDRLRSLARARGASLYMAMAALFALLLYRYTGQKDIRMGAPAADRQRADTHGLVGYLTNLLVLRAGIDPARGFARLLAEVREAVLEAHSHQDLPFDLLVEALQPERRAGVHPLFQVKCTEQAAPPPVRRCAGVELRLEELSGGRARFDLSFDFTDGPGGIAGVFVYAAALFEPATVAGFAEAFRTLAEQAVAAPEAPLAGLRLPGPLSELSGPRAGFPRRDVLELWSDAVERTPAAPAVRCEDAVFGYAELDAEAERLAAALTARGVGPEARVAIHAERGPEFVLGVLAVLKAGGAYLPLDPKLPAERLAYQFADSGARLLLAAGEPPAWAASAPSLALAFAGGPRVPGRARRTVHPGQAAYVIYTSGSTGQPKGVTVGHGALGNYVQAVLARLDLPEDAAGLAMVSTVAADLGHTALFGALCSGRTLHLIGAERAFDPDGFAEYMARWRVDVLKIVPSHLQVLLQAARAAEALPRHALILGGEAAHGPLLERIRSLRPDCRVVNHYGPTEATVGALVLADPAPGNAAALPLGRPLANLDALVLDAELNPLPWGAAGELYLGGAGLARGYLDRAGLTAERFLPHPRRPGERLYRTGDRARGLPDGSLEFLGRADGQVKIRGYRVEPGEVRAAILGQAEVAEAEVAAWPDPDGRARLCAYVVPRPGAALDGNALRGRLAGTLPDYMLPAAVMILDALPLTPNGKPDRKALPPPRIDAGDDYAAPQGATEESLARIWAEVLRVERVGRHDDFLGLGGDSILVLQIVARARKQGLKLTPKQMMEQPTIARVAALLASAGDALPRPSPAEAEAEERDIPLTPVQRWFFEQPIPDRHHWNQSVLLDIDEPLEAARLELALGRLVERHGALALQFVEEGGQWRQRRRARAEDGWRFSRVAPGEDGGGAFERAQRGLDLRDGPLLWAVWAEAGAERPGRLLLVAHHLVVDAVSWRVLVEDLRGLYREAGAPAEATPFRNWARRLREYADSEALRRELPYWLAADRADPAWPAARPGGDNRVGSMRRAEISLDRRRTGQLLRDCLGAYRLRAEDLLLAALADCLCEWSGLGSVRVELEGHGREDVFGGLDLSRSVGWFTALYPVRLAAGADLRETLLGVKETLRRVPNRGLGYGVLRYLSGHGRDLAAPQPYLSFNYLGRIEPAEPGGWRPASAAPGPERSPEGPRRAWFDVIARVEDGRLRIDWHYSANLHEPSTVEALARRHGERLDEMIEHCLRDGAGGLSPSDVPLARLAQEQLDDLRLDAANVEDLYPLAPMQQGLLLHTLLTPGSGMYLMQDRYRFAAVLDVAAFTRAWDEVVRRHAVLRTGFLWRTGQAPLQVVYRRVPTPVQCLDWRGMDEAEAGRRLDELLREELAQGFDLGRPPLLRLRLIRRGEDDFRLVQSFHHILMDAWCRSLLLTDFFAHYAAYRDGRTLSAAPPRPYRDFIAWLGDRDLDAARRYWREQLEGFDTATPLPWRKDAGIPAGAAVADRQILLPAGETAALRHLAQHHRLTLNTVVQGAWALLLARLGKLGEVLFGVTVAGRPPELEGIQETVGLFINTIPLRVRLPSPDTPLAEWLRRLLAQNLAMRQHEHVPLVDIQALGDMPRGRGLFDCLFVFENAPLDASLEDRAREFGVTVGGNRTHTNYPLTVVAVPGERLLLQLSYDSRQFAEADAARLLAGFRHLLAQFAGGPEARLHQLSVLPEEQRAALFARCDGRAAAYPFERGYIGLFEERVRLHPRNPAARCRGQSIDYAGLDAEAGRIGHALRRRGVGRDAVVALCAERGLALLAMILGTFKAGGAYLALDGKHPPRRLAGLLSSSRAQVLVATADQAESLAAALALLPNPPELLLYETLAAEPQPQREPAVPVHPDQAAYVIYTSGSTGEPKGVVVTQRGMLNNQLSKIPYLGLTERDVIGQTASQNFDISVWQLLAGLLCGACVDIVPDSIARDPAALPEYARSAGITVLQSVPALIQGMLAAAPTPLPALRWMLPTGEASTAELARLWFERYLAVPLVNAYGPAECADDVALYRLSAIGEEAARFLPIGEPTDNTRLLVLDGNLDPLPAGIAGELYVAGAGVGRGYLNQPGFTAERFLPDPHVPLGGGRLYRTGDIARWRDDGVLEYLGRADSQVKLRGLRIELGEIEARLAECEEVREAAVSLYEDARGERRLVGYLVPRGGEPGGAAAEPWRERLRSRLAGALPDYMVPTLWMVLERLPLTPNGKLDRRALPAPDPVQAQAAYEAPRGELETAAAEVWAEVLGVERVGRDDGFFELGGHSLLALQVAARLQARTRLDVPLAALFETRTLAGFAARLAELRPHGGEEALQALDSFIDSLEEV